MMNQYVREHLAYVRMSTHDLHCWLPVIQRWYLSEFVNAIVASVLEGLIINKLNKTALKFLETTPSEVDPKDNRLPPKAIMNFIFNILARFARPNFQ